MSRTVLSLLCWVCGGMLGMTTGAVAERLFREWGNWQNQKWLTQQDHWLYVRPGIAGGMHSIEQAHPEATATEHGHRKYQTHAVYESQLTVASPWDLNVTLLSSIPTRWRQEGHFLAWVDARTVRLHLGHFGGPNTALDIEVTAHALD